MGSRKTTGMCCVSSAVSMGCIHLPCLGLRRSPAAEACMHAIGQGSQRQQRIRNVINAARWNQACGTGTLFWRGRGERGRPIAEYSHHSLSAPTMGCLPRILQGHGKHRTLHRAPPNAITPIPAPISPHRQPAQLLRVRK